MRGQIVEMSSGDESLVVLLKQRAFYSWDSFELEAGTDDNCSHKSKGFTLRQGTCCVDMLKIYSVDF